MTEEIMWTNSTIEIVGKVISFWGFKENHGKIWALLYLNNRSYSTSEIRRYFGFSKGATSMLLQDLEDWKVIHRTNTTERERHFQANSHFIAMIGNVLQQREGDLIAETLLQLGNIKEEALNSSSSTEQLKRLNDMIDLANLMSQLVEISNKMRSRNIQELSKILKLVNKIL